MTTLSVELAKVLFEYTKTLNKDHQLELINFLSGDTIDIPDIINILKAIEEMQIATPSNIIQFNLN